MITRSVLDMRMIVPSEDIHSKVVDKILADQEILEMWEKVASGVLNTPLYYTIQYTIQYTTIY